MSDRFPSRRGWAPLSERLPVDVRPRSNGEFIPPPPGRHHLAAMALADAESSRLGSQLGMSRRRFVRTAAATAVGLWAIDAVSGGTFGNYARGDGTPTTDACDLEYAEATGDFSLRNQPGELIFDVQTHHVDPDGLWRVTNPAFHAAFALLWPQSGPRGEWPRLRPDGSLRGFGAGEVDPIANLSRHHYLKELYLDSATNVTVLSSVPTSPDTNNPLPVAEAADTVALVNQLAGSERCVMHAFVMPNRGASGTFTGRGPSHLDEELALMARRAELYRGILRGWKVYCPWGDVPYASGWFLDDPDVGDPFLRQVTALSDEFGIPPVVAAHKGFALPGFDQRAASPRDVGPAAATHRGVRFVIYHSGHDIGEGPQRPYPGDETVRPDARSVDSLIRSLRTSGVAATDGAGAPAGHLGVNSPNVWAELGSVWRDYMGDPDSAAHLLGKLITNVGPRRVVWGTDSLWNGSPQPEIAALRRFDFTAEGRELYRLPHGLEGHVDDPQRRWDDSGFALDRRRPAFSIRNGIFGRNAAEVYEIDPDARRLAISCDAVNDARDHYLTDPLSMRESAPLASNAAPGIRDRRAFLNSWRNRPWAP